VSAELVPGWEPPMPPPAPTGMPPTARDGAAGVYLPSCVNRMFGRSPADEGPASLPAALVAVSLRAGRPLWIPADVAGTCCATPWTSKGYADGAAWMSNATVEKLWRWSDGGELPVVIDASSCTHGLLESAPGLSPINARHLEGMQILDSIEWATRHLIDKLDVGERIDRLVIHPTCSATHLGINGELERLASELADEVVVPTEATCCGFAGDRGFLHPELTASATELEAAEVTKVDADAHISANRTCEIGLERATGERYESFVYLLERLTRPG
jgi:D-lactate dehydrogenase